MESSGREGRGVWAVAGSFTGERRSFPGGSPVSEEEWRDGWAYGRVLRGVGFMYTSVGSPSEQDAANGTGQDDQVQPHRPVPYVVDVHPHPLFEGVFVTPAATATAPGPGAFQRQLPLADRTEERDPERRSVLLGGCYAGVRTKVRPVKRSGKRSFGRCEAAEFALRWQRIRSRSSGEAR